MSYDWPRRAAGRYIAIPYSRNAVMRCIGRPFIHFAVYLRHSGLNLTALRHLVHPGHMLRYTDQPPHNRYVPRITLPLTEAAGPRTRKPTHPSLTNGHWVNMMQANVAHRAVSLPRHSFLARTVGQTAKRERTAWLHGWAACC